MGVDFSYNYGAEKNGYGEVKVKDACLSCQAARLA